MRDHIIRSSFLSRKALVIPAALWIVVIVVVVSATQTDQINHDERLKKHEKKDGENAASARVTKSDLYCGRELNVD